MLCYLRIAFSATCGVLCLLLIALWVRSYSWADVVSFHPGASNHTTVYYTVTVREGVFTFSDLSGTVLNVPPTSRWSNYRRKLGPHDLTKSSVWARVFRGFHWNTFNSVWIPAWCFVLVSGALATAPWLRWRFSLRTLLIAMTVVAVLLGVLVLIN
jgi:hypothetical protein